MTVTRDQHERRSRHHRRDDAAQQGQPAGYREGDQRRHDDEAGQHGRTTRVEGQDGDCDEMGSGARHEQVARA